MEIDPEIAAALASSPIGSFDFGTIDLERLPNLRVALEAIPRPEVPPTTTVYRDEIVPGAESHPDVTVRIYQPPTESSGRSCVYWIHGGGYMFGSALVPDPRANRWSEELDCLVVAVEYRLAPEHPYPGPLEDCYAGLAWTARHAAELSIDPMRIAIAGASAGGGLAAGLALLARDRGEIEPCFQLLMYPMIDDRNVTPSSQMTDAAVWSRAANILGWRAYLGRKPVSDGVSPYAAAAPATDLAGLPPAFIGVGTLDVFRDECIDYAMRLLAAGVPAELHVYPGAPHGFESLTSSAAVSQRFSREIDDALRRALAPEPSYPAV